MPCLWAWSVDSWQRAPGNPVWQHGTRPSFPSSATHEKVTHRDLAVEIKLLSRLLSDRRNLQKLMKGMHPLLLQRELEAHLTKPRVLHIIDHTQEAYFWPLVMKIFLPHPKHMALPAWTGCSGCWGTTSAGRMKYRVARKGYGKERLRNTSLLTETSRRVWWLQCVPFWNGFFIKAGKCFQRSWEHQRVVFQPLHYISCHQNFGVCIQQAECVKTRAATCLELQGRRNQHCETTLFFFFSSPIENKTLKNHSDRDNCWQLTSRPDSSPDFISGLASSLSSYLPLSGPSLRSQAATSRIRWLHWSEHLAPQASCGQGTWCPVHAAGRPWATSWLQARASSTGLRGSPAALRQG